MFSWMNGIPLRLFGLLFRLHGVGCPAVYPPSSVSFCWRTVSVWTCVLCCVDSSGCWGKTLGENWIPCSEGSAVSVSSPRPMVCNRNRPSPRRLDCCPRCPSSSVVVHPVELHSVGCGSCTMGVQAQKACPASPLWMLHCCCCLCSQVN